MKAILGVALANDATNPDADPILVARTIKAVPGVLLLTTLVCVSRPT